MKAAASVEICRPIEDVFTFVSSVEAMEQWVDGMTDTRHVGGAEPGVGARYESSYSYGGGTTDMVFEVTEYDPPRGFGIRAPEGPFAFEGRLELETTDRGTLVTNTIEVGPDSRVTAIMFTVLAPLMRYLMARRLRAELRVLKQLLEPDDSPTPGESTTGTAGD